ncbi:AAA family ATPase [Spirulina sp. 06S082]|uniref:AAA family ATPase n=1 Tax=Spirulina sp. 06S082 TaxID=3110248 RepID=UPI002B209F46|nr:AAA family ATPase [Spirulina sp. 06S082]MEA5470045.1 AAA family ATPase [Spirulina sp. 06S082]
MRIKQISVSGLFGIFNHVIPLNMSDRITIIHAPNGFGKTIILKMLNGLFNSKHSIFWTIPFNNFRVDFNDNSSLAIKKESEDSNGVNKKDKITFTFQQSQSKPIIFTPIKVKDNIRPDINFPMNIFDDIIPGLDRVALQRWLYTPTDEILSLEEVIERFEDVLPSKFRLLGSEPEWLTEVRNSIHVRIIESQRLFNTSSQRHPRYFESPLPMSATVSEYSSEIAGIIKAKLTEYGTTSQALDRTFPARLVEQKTAPDLVDDQLRLQLDELEKKRSRLIEVGLLDKDKSSDFQIQPQTIDESTKNILSVYIEDVKKKLSVFDEIASKIDLLREIINKKFEYSCKEINFSKEKGFIFTTKHDKKILSPTDLSSGEQHELVLLYELLFKVEPNSLVLIDEPEISLHLGWQVQFLKDLQEITKLANIDILMTTHSPDIIQDRWDLTVELKGVSS